MENILKCALDIGERMLTSGGEVHRVEDSVSRIATALGAERADIFIITSHMTATVFDKEGNSHTQTRRINGGNTNIEMLHRLNSLSRSICEKHPTCEEIEAELKEIEKSSSYPFPYTVAAQAVIAGAFCLFFGGGIGEAFAALLIGALLRIANKVMEIGEINNIFSKLLCSALATGMSIFLVRMGAVPTIDNIMIGNIMALIPGVGFTNAMRDLFMGDSITGILRTIEAVLVALAIAAGYFAVAYTFGGGVI